MDALLFQAEALRMEKLMYHVSFTMLRNQADCADAVQEALTRAWQKRASLKSVQSFQPWLMRILVNQCNDMLRRRSKRRFFSLEEAETAAVTPPPEASFLREAMDQLRPELRLAIVLHYLEGFSVQEISQITGAPSGTVKSRLKTARNRLGVLLKDNGEEVAQ